MGLLTDLRPRYDGENRTINRLPKDVDPKALEKLGYQLEKDKDKIRAITHGIPIIGNVVDYGYDLKKFQESQKWLDDWHRNIGRQMAYPLLARSGDIPQISNDIAGFIKGSLYEPPKRAKRRF